MPQLFVLPRQLALDDDANPLSGALLYFYRTESTTPQAIYSDLSLAIQHSNPVVADAAGEFPKIYLDSSADFAYRMSLTTASGVQLYQEDDIQQFTVTPTEILAALYPQTEAEEAVSVTPTDFRYAPGDVRRYGVIGNGIANDTAAFQRALSVGGPINAPAGLTILIANTLTLGVAKSTIDLNGSVLKFSSSYDDAGTNNLIMLTVSAADVTICNVIFDGTAKAGESNRNAFVQFPNNSSRGKVYNCRFISLGDGGNDANCAVLFLTGADDGEIYSCSFHDCPGSGFSQGARARFSNCVVTAPKDVSFALNGPNCVGGSVIGCKIFAQDITVSGHIAAEEAAADWVFADNYIYGVKNGGGIAALNVAVTTLANGGVIANNVIDGGGYTTTGPSALISVSQYYRGCRIVNNILSGMPAGLAANAAITVPALLTLLQGNKINATTGTSSVGAVVITPAGGQIDIIDNYSDCTGGPARHFVFQNGDNSSAPAIFEGGTFIGGTTAIDTDLNDPTNLPVWLVNLKRNTATALLALTATDSIEDFFNSHSAIAWPHSIKSRRVCYGNAAPTNGTWSQGDCVMSVAPTASNPPGWVCVADGTPGTWKAMAVLAS